MMNGAAEYKQNGAIEAETPDAPKTHPTKIGRIITAVKKTIQKYRSDYDGQVFMSSNFKFDN